MSDLCIYIPLIIAAVVIIGYRVWLIGAFEGGKSAIRAVISRIKPQ